MSLCPSGFRYTASAASPGTCALGGFDASVDASVQLDVPARWDAMDVIDDAPNTRDAPDVPDVPGVADVRDVPTDLGPTTRCPSSVRILSPMPNERVFGISVDIRFEPSNVPATVRLASGLACDREQIDFRSSGGAVNVVVSGPGHDRAGASNLLSIQGNRPAVETAGYLREALPSQGSRPQTTQQFSGLLRGRVRAGRHVEAGQGDHQPCEGRASRR